MAFMWKNVEENGMPEGAKKPQGAQSCVLQVNNCQMAMLLCDLFHKTDGFSETKMKLLKITAITIGTP